MNPDENAWKIFEKTGSISDYINYVNIKNNADYTSQNEGTILYENCTDFKGNDSRRDSPIG